MICTLASLCSLLESNAEKPGGASVQMQNDRPTSSKPQKEKSTKAERRALQEAQRAAKAAAKGADGSDAVLLQS